MGYILYGMGIVVVVVVVVLVFLLDLMCCDLTRKSWRGEERRGEEMMKITML